VVFFDVGQGDAIFIRTPQEQTILIDGGPGSKVLEHLGREMSFLEKEIDLAILTHPHYDHVAGLMEVLEAYEVEEVMCTGIKGDSGVAKKWEKIREKEEYRVAREGKRVTGEGFQLDILYPQEDLRGETVSDLNTVSVVAYLTMEGKRFLFTGDAYMQQEEEILSSYHLPEVDVLKVGHHGSQTSTLPEFVSKIKPSYGVIMAGEDNRYGHPHEETIDTLENKGTKVLRTDKDGTIRFVY